MARNRKRAKERRARRPQPVGSRAREETNRPVPESVERGRINDPLAGAAPDAELAQQAEIPPGLTEPELEELALHEGQVENGEAEAYEDDATFEEEEESEAGAGGGRRGGARFGGGFDGGAAEAGGGELAAPRARSGNRLITFLEGSWRELQRVQWPDRRQVVQATSVVIGFVILAGAFLGVADYLANHVVNYILNGNW